MQTGKYGSPLPAHLNSDTAGSVAMLVKYIGTGTSATVAVAAGGDMTFQVAAANDTTVNTTGTIDCSTPGASTDTMGEVCDLINASANWVCVLVDALRSDSTDNTLAELSTAQATRADGVALYFDSAVAASYHAGMALLPPGYQTDIRPWIAKNGKPLENPFAGQQTAVRWVEGYSTYATTGTFNIYSVKPKNRKTGGSETVTTLWSEGTGLSTANKQLTQFQYFPLLGRVNEKVIVRITDTGASSTFVLHAYGERLPL